jgi:hypothetical protein
LPGAECPKKKRDGVPSLRPMTNLRLSSGLAPLALARGQRGAYMCSFRLIVRLSLAEPDERHVDHAGFISPLFEYLF